MSKSPTYYPALDGFRAVAVLLVLFQHYAATFVRYSGWMGVDLFFVLSGFLITGILWDNREKPHRFRNFYVRRVLRIFPLYYGVWIVLFLMSIAGFHWHWSAIWILWPVHLGNFARFITGDVHATDVLVNGGILQRWLPAVNPGHFWSLCLEEQFYLFWPLLVFRASSRKRLMQICIAIVILSPVARALVQFTLPQHLLDLEFNYRVTFMRLDSLAFGGLLALMLRGPEKVWVEGNHALRNVLLLGPAAVLFGGMLVIRHGVADIDPLMATLGYSLIDLAAAGLILECIRQGSPLYRILGVRPLRELGKISYGFYVFHDLPHTFYVAIARRFGGHIQVEGVLLAFVGTLFLSVLSYRFYELPFLRLKDKLTVEIHRAPAP